MDANLRTAVVLDTVRKDILNVLVRNHYCNKYTKSPNKEKGYFGSQF
jgi:hypothetical protein